MNEAEIATSRYRCYAEGCMRHPASGDTIIRTSPKGQPFKGLCADEHYQEPADPVIAGIEHALLSRITTDTGWRQLRGDGSVAMCDPPPAAPAAPHQEGTP